MESNPSSSATNTQSEIRMVVVTNSEQLMHAFAVRSICFMEETGLSAQQALDGNDYLATHIVAYLGTEPIGATRLRWFRDFAKIERTAFRKAYRSARILKQCSDFIFDHATRKGYTTLVTHAEAKYARVWQRVLGFEIVEGRPLVVTEGHEPYMELVKHLAPSADAITISADPRLLFRVEGAWHVPSAFE